ncbi:hypothetical protein HDZ31DRAFT_34862 [Schizophyllum fasciatum]
MPPTRVALVTGAAQGIGKAISLRLSADGFSLALADLPAKQPALADVACLIAAGGGRAAVFTGDVSVEEDVRRMVDGAAEKLGGFHVIVANAGISIPRSLLEETPEGFDLQMAVNARSVFLAFKHAARQIIAQGHREGRLIAACSICGKHGYSNTAAYSASKFAIRGITQSAAHELGPHGITVNAYAPGGIDTEMSERAPSFCVPLTHTQMANSVPVKRIGQPEDIANLVSYLASKEASYMTGQTVRVFVLSASGSDADWRCCRYLSTAGGTWTRVRMRYRCDLLSSTGTSGAQRAKCAAQDGTHKGDIGQAVYRHTLQMGCTSFLPSKNTGGCPRELNLTAPGANSLRPSRDLLQICFLQ